MPAKKVTAKATKTVKTLEVLKTELLAKQTDLLDFRRSLAAGELTNPRIVTVTRREIARLKTALTMAEQSGKGEK